MTGSQQYRMRSILPRLRKRAKARRRPAPELATPPAPTPRRPLGLSGPEREAAAASVTGLVYKHAGYYYRTRVRPAGGGDEDYDDLVAAGWHGVAAALARFDATAGTRFITCCNPWIVSKVQDEAEKAQRRLAHTVRFADTARGLHKADEAEFAEHLPDRRPPADLGELAEEAARVFSLIPDRRGRVILYLKAVRGMTYKEIAPHFGVTRQQVQNIYRRVVADCRTRLGLVGDAA